MNQNTEGDKPDDRDSTPLNPAESENKNGAEPEETHPVADNQSKSKPVKKVRKTYAQRIADAQRKKEEAAAQIRKLKADMDKASSKELTKLKLVLGEACLTLFNSSEKPEAILAITQLLCKCADQNSRQWLEEELRQRFPKRPTPKREAKPDDSNGDSPSQ